MTSEPATGEQRDTARKLVIVESPAKGRTIARFLGPDFVVESSIGHVRDLPSSASEIPARYKGQPWARVGVDVDHGFQPIYIVPADKKQQVRKLKRLLKGASELYLATDEDREGEAIAWHLQQVLQPRVPVKRMIFHEITRPAIEQALASPRDIDEELVEAQEARRIMDRIYGYEVSPVLWRKVRPRLSAGRVQSAALRLIVDRERARMRFVSAGFWDVEATLRPRGAADGTVPARLVEIDARRVATGRDFDAESGQLRAGAPVALLDERRAQAVAEAVRPVTFVVADLEERPYTQRPPAPFITSTLQQEAARQLRFTAQRTMRVAQGLYENGYITYMRTDSTNLSTQAVQAARSQVRTLYGDEFLPPAPRRYASGERAQEAHEAIRPAGEAFRTPQSLRNEIDADGRRLYELIWKRTVASQMRDAAGLRTNVRLSADAGDQGAAVFAASGRVITFPGFLRAYVEGSDDPDAELADQERLLPPLTLGQQLQAENVEARGHQTQPPARFTEASLVHELEERGIGRPSTYASIIQTVQDRGYVWKKSSALVPTFVAFAVIQLLERHFPELVDLSFTARMEGCLDAIAVGEMDSTPWLHDFYFGGGEGTVDEDVEGIGLKARLDAGWEAIDAREVSSIPLGADGQGRTVAVRVGRYGPYIQADDEDTRASVPDGIAPDELTLERALELLEQAQQGDRVIGADPESGLPVYLRTGRFGPYVELGTREEGDEEGERKPRRASLWPSMSMDSLTLDEALLALSFPRTLGLHPQSGEEIIALDGPRGPYLKMGKETRSLRDHDHLRSLTLEDAVALLAEPKRSRRSAVAELASLGEHPQSGEPVKVLRGRFGPYVTDGVVNASLPRGRDPATVTLEDAVELIAAREERLRQQGKDPRAPKQARPRRRAPARRTSTRRKRSA